MRKSVLVAMSGGIDSTITALLLKQQGLHVDGICFRFFDDEECTFKANDVARQLNIKLQCFDAREIFKREVIGHFVEKHCSGETPSVCFHCNAQVKWKLLSDVANSSGYDYIATGHYIRLKELNGIQRIFKANDLLKDQSYYLWKLGPEILKKAILPLGDFQKKRIKELAYENGFGKLVKIKESTGICFARGRKIKQILDEHILTITPGVIIDRSGKEVGTHPGSQYFTIGQKKGLNLYSKSKDICVAEIDVKENVLLVDTWQNLYKNSFTISGTYFASPDEISRNSNLQVMVRGFGLNPKGNCTLHEREPGIFRVDLENPAWAVAPGQPAVFYSNDKLVGGGVITKNNND